jgi:hypothetical protein
MKSGRVENKKGHLSDKCLALLDVLLQLRKACIEKFLFLSRDIADGVYLLNTVDLRNKEMNDLKINETCVLTPSSTLVAKKSIPWSANRELLTKVGVTMPFSPFNPRNRELVNLAPA